MKNWIWWWRQYQKVLRLANTLPKEDQCRRTKSSKRQPISQRETNCLFDLRIFSICWILWWNSRIIGVSSVSNWRTTTFRTLLYVGSNPSDKVPEGPYVSKLQDSSQAQTIMHCTTKKFCEEEENEIISDWECVCEIAYWTKLNDVKISGFRVWPLLMGRGTIPSPSGRQESAFSEGKWVLFKRRLQ